MTTVFFLKAGLKLHNEAILVTSVGSLPVRVAKGFEVNRKLGKTHQNILVFVKGDPRKASAEWRTLLANDQPISPTTRRRTRAL